MILGAKKWRPVWKDECFPDESLRNGASMQKKVLEFISEHQMLERGDRLVVGVSGGADSVCLLHLLHGCRESYDLELFAVHVNHGLRGEEATRDEMFVLELCERLAIPCRPVHLDIREEAKRLQISEEEAGREWRYRAFLDEAKRQTCTKLAVAHHMDDNAETVLFRMFRGTGVNGLAGIAPINTMCFESMLCSGHISSDRLSSYLESEGNNNALTVIRPLLCVTRAEVEAYLKECGQEYCVDSTNSENFYSRNRIRNEILPVAGRYINAQSVRNLNALAQHAGKVTEYLERQAGELYRQCVTTGKDCLKVVLQGNEEQVLLELVFRTCLYRLSGRMRDISTVHIEALCGLCKKQVGSSLDLPYGISAKRIYEGIRLFVKQKGANPERETEVLQSFAIQEAAGGIIQDVSVMLSGQRGQLKFSVKNIEVFGPEPFAEIRKIAQNDYTKCFDYDKIKGNISVRVPQESDYFCIHPDGRRKLLKDYLVDVKIPQEERSALYLVTEEDLVLWILGRRTSENRRISEQTQKVLLIEWNL